MAKCSGTNQAGGPCGKSAIVGGTVCWNHGGNLPQVRRKAIVRANLADWGINDDLVDPGETLLRLVSQSARRAAFYADLLQVAYEQAETDTEKGVEDLVGLGTPVRLPSGVAALIGKKYTITENYGRVAVGEAIRGLTILEMQERKLCADFAEKAIRAGLAERQVRLAEQMGAVVVGAVKAALERAGITGPALLEAQDVAADYILSAAS